MPKAGTADREPADVKRGDAVEGTPPVASTKPIEMADISQPAKLDKMPFFDMLASLSEREWEDRLVYLYRGDGAVIKANEKDDKYIERIAHKFDEDYVKQKHGGGAFLAILKNTRVRNGAERKHIFKIEGAPIIHDDEVSTRRAKNEASGEKSDNALLLEQLERLTHKLLDSASKSNGAEQDTISRSIAMLSEASKGALLIQQESIKNQLTSTTGHPMVDRFLEKAIAKLGDEPKGDSLEQFKQMLALARELTKGNDRPAGAGSGLLGNLGEIKGVLEILKDLGIKIGGGGGAEAAAEGGMDWKSVLASTLPQALQVVGGYVDRWIQTQQEQNRILGIHTENARRAAAGQPQLPAAPPQVQTFANPPAAPPPPAGPIAPGPQASALPPNFAAATPPQQNPAPAQAGEVLPFPAATNAPAQLVEVDLDFVCTLIRRCFDAGDPGDIPAISLKRIYGASLDPLQPYFSDGEQLKQLAGMTPIIAEIIPDPEFPAFLAEFVEEMNRNEDEDLPDPGADGGKGA
jgi:hypothetical protein